MTRKPVDPSMSYVDMSEEQMKALWLAWYPAGSGPLGAMKTICALLESIAHMRGFDPSQWGKDLA